jgi:phenylpropionate dioxygenase-like ring-hydroxylating dioxygenase large terminal subunit
MFTNQHHLRHVLRPDQYTSEEQYRTELRQLFLPAWHPIAALAEIPQPGDFLTLDLLETPILLRNFGGELRAFRNVCPHRHSLLTDRPRGHSDTLRCQYHGWEYDREGHTGRIPDARAFRPWDREHACLQSFRVATCGDLVFINLSDNSLSLRDWLEPVWDAWQSYGGAYRHALTWEQDFPCNWKVVLENSLESYHIPQVHPTTFKDFAPEENVWHELTPRFSSFRTIPPRDFAARAMDWLTRRLGQPITGEYWHRVLHPHTTGSSLDVFQMMQCVFPTGPRTCRYRSILFTLRGRRAGPFAWACYKFLRWTSTMVSRKVFDEDATIYRGVQRGLEASPHRGVIGTREERVHAFQEYVDRECGAAGELPSLNGPDARETPQRNCINSDHRARTR